MPHDVELILSTFKGSPSLMNILNKNIFEKNTYHSWPCEQSHFLVLVIHHLWGKQSWLNTLWHTTMDHHHHYSVCQHHKEFLQLDTYWTLNISVWAYAFKPGCCHMYDCIHMRAHTHTHTHTYTHTSKQMHTHTHIYITCFSSSWTYTFKQGCYHTSMTAHTHTCMYTWMHTHTSCI